MQKTYKLLLIFFFLCLFISMVVATIWHSSLRRICIPGHVLRRHTLDSRNCQLGQQFLHGSMIPSRCWEWTKQMVCNKRTSQNRVFCCKSKFCVKRCKSFLNDSTVLNVAAAPFVVVVSSRDKIRSVSWCVLYSLLTINLIHSVLYTVHSEFSKKHFPNPSMLQFYLFICQCDGIAQSPSKPFILFWPNPV